MVKQTQTIRRQIAFKGLMVLVSSLRSFHVRREESKKFHLDHFAFPFWKATADMINCNAWFFQSTSPTEAVTQRCSVKKVFSVILQKLTDSNTGVFP